MSRMPVVPTLLVALAVAAMIALGIWQLDRREQKLALLALYAANGRQPPIALPASPDDRLLFRRTAAVCFRPAGWSREAGRAADGATGWRAIAQCGGGAGGAGFAAQMGVGADPLRNPVWRGGRVSGYLTRAPQHRSLIAGALEHAPEEMMIVADTPLPGLKPNQPASLADIPNNHLAYAVQWFLFAAVAAIVYAVALWRRRHPVATPPERG